LRFLMTLLPVLVISAIFLLKALIPVAVHVFDKAIPARNAIIGAAAMLSLFAPIRFASGRPGPVEYVLDASNVLHAAGMQSADDVLSTHTWLQDASANTRQRFPQAYWVAPDQASIEHIAQTMAEQGRAYLVYDRDTGPRAYPLINAEAMLSPEKNHALFAPVYLSPDRSTVIYALKAAAVKGCQPIAAQFANGIRLDCARVIVSQDAWPNKQRRLGMYLNWIPTHTLDEPWKVFVHLLDSQGQLVAQTDGAPVLWTHPTTAWKANEPVMDFHTFTIDDQPGIEDETFTLRVGMYNEKTGQRLPILMAQTDTVDDSVTVAQGTLFQ
jgi:hypothetical protein